MAGTAKKAAGSEEVQPAWASSDSIPDQDYEDVLLPRMNRMVRVRYLDTVEMVRLTYLPDYAGYIELVRQLTSGEISDEDFDPSLADAETVNYEACVAHRAIVDPAHDEEVVCLDCGYRHQRSLFTTKQCRRMPKVDLEFVAAIALRATEVAAMAPFSEEPTQNGSDVPASTGGSTQPTNSADQTPPS